MKVLLQPFCLFYCIKIHAEMVEKSQVKNYTFSSIKNTNCQIIKEISNQSMAFTSLCKYVFHRHKNLPQQNCFLKYCWSLSPYIASNINDKRGMKIQ